MKILITGAAGFIGSHIVDKYVEEGHEVYCLDKSDFPDDWDHVQRPGLSKDLKDWSREELISRLSSFDVVNHHAAAIDLRQSLEDPCNDAWINIGMTIKLLDCCVKAGVKRFIYASSGGAIDNSEFPESPYGIAKLSSEKYLNFFNKHHGLETVSLRYSNVYGPRQKGGVVSIFIPKLLKNEQITINGGGQLRDFIHVSDVAEVNNLALTCDSGIYTISSGTSVSIDLLATDLKALCNSNSAIIRNPTIEGEVMVSRLTPSYPAGFTPKFNLLEGLRNTISSFQ